MSKQPFNIQAWCNSRGQHYLPMFEYLQTHPVKRILEIGTFNGDNAVGMINSTSTPNEEIEYYGFDLFEHSGESDRQLEGMDDFNKPPTITDVSAKIAGTGACIFLVKGNSKITIPQTVLPIMDFIYIDGGHSVDTIRSDWHNVQKCIDKHTVIFFDDYYIGVYNIGCAFLQNELVLDKFTASLVGVADVYPVFVSQLMMVTKNG